MKPYLVQRIKYQPSPGSGMVGQYIPDDKNSPTFIMARSPKDAAAKVCKWRGVHDGKDQVHVRVRTLEEECPVDYSPTKDFWVEMQTKVRMVTPDS